MVDAKAVITERLLDATLGLRDLVGDSVAWGRLPDGFSGAQKAVVLNRQSGAPDNDLDVDVVLLNAKCYGGSELEEDCDAVAAALCGALHEQHMVVLEAGVIVNSHCVNWSDTADPDIERCPVAMLMFEVTVKGK